MPKESNGELSSLNQQILDVLSNTVEPAKISEIKARLSPPIPRRTLYRHLSNLTLLGKLVVIGKGSGTKYSLAKTTRKTTGFIPLSSKAQEILVKIDQPIQQKKPIGYQHNFLYDYQPNVTYYLPEATRNHLRSVGQQFNHELEAGTYVKKVLHRLLIDLSWNSSRLEGNTYSLLETKRLIEFGAEADGKNSIDAQMILNHKDAIEFMVGIASELGFKPYIILSIHAFLSNNLIANPRSRGQLRQIPVSIGQTVYHPPEIPHLIVEYFERILQTAEAIFDPFEQAFFAMVHLPYLQPFEDVNKRVSRLSANIPLIKHNLCPLSFIDVPKSDYISGILGIYELNRIEFFRDVFIWAYERSAMHYQLVVDTITEPNIIQLRYKQELQQLINFIVMNNIRGNNILLAIQKWGVENIKAEDQAEFMKIAEQELASLHTNNIAIYKISPQAFSQWFTV